MIADNCRSNPLLTDRDSPRNRYMMILSYDGAPFYGWQVQPNRPSVQQAIEEALRTVLHIPLHIVGAGRTDTGVNARHMTAHFDIPSSIEHRLLADNEGLQKLAYTLNAILKPHITIHHIVKVENDLHARFDATERTYRYYVHTTPDPFRSDRSRYIYTPIDFDAMNRETKYLIGTQDFTSFSKLHTDTNNNICTVTKARWVQYGPSHFYFEITANRFLRNMVRAVVGTLLEVGTQKEKEGYVKKVIEAMDRCKAGPSMPGHALYLWDIKYPYELPSNPLPDNL